MTLREDAPVVLAGHNITKAFGATHALRGVDFKIRAGEVVALIGENGAGKSTLMKILSGVQPPTSGTIELDGEPISFASTTDAVAHGVAIVHQELNLCPNLSVVDNIFLGREITTATGLARGKERVEALAALEKLEAARKDGSIAAVVTALSKDLAFNLGGHTNHSLFWENLSPNGGGKPTGALAAAIDEDFGSFEEFQKHFAAAALGLQGSGWAVLAYDKIGERLVIEQMTDQQGNLSIDLVPLLLLDMWEHAFYLQYKNVKADYVAAVWNVFNWDEVAARYAAAVK